MIPTAPGALPVLGHLPSLFRDRLGLLRSLPAQGNLVRLKFGPVEAVVVCDLPLTRQVLRDDKTFDKGGTMYDRLREVLGDGLASSPHRRHRRQRRLVQPSFIPSRLPGYARVMTEQVDATVAGWRDGQVLDVLHEMTTITAKIVAGTLFAGTTLSDTVYGPAMRQLLADLERIPAGIFRRMVTVRPLDRIPTPANLGYHRAIARLRRTCAELIAHHRAHGTDHGDILSALLAAQDADGSGLSDAEIADQVVTFVLGGTETTASGLAWALHLLAEHPDIEERVHAEACGDPADSPEDLSRLGLTGRVITETLRVRPPGWMFTRIATRDTELAGHLVRSGTVVIFSPYLIHHHAELYPDPDRFDPDRWLPPVTVPRDAFLAFGDHARRCVGEQYGFTEAVILLSAIVRRWRLEAMPGEPVRPFPGIVLTPDRLRMRVTARSHPSTPQKGPHRR